MRALKKTIFVFLVIAMTLSTSLVIADVGNFESYDSDWGGSSWDSDWDSDWGSSSWDYGGSSYGGSYSYGGGRNICICYYYYYNSRYGNVPK